MTDVPGVLGDHAAFALAKHLVQHHHRDSAAAQQLTEYRARPYRRKLVSISHQYQIGVYLLRHGQGVCITGSQVLRFMDRAGGKAAALLQSPGRTACGCAADNVRIRERLPVDVQKNTLNGCLASTRAAGNNTDWGCEGGLNRLPLLLRQCEAQFLLLLVNLIAQVADIGQAAPLEHFLPGSMISS